MLSSEMNRLTLEQELNDKKLEQLEIEYQRIQSEATIASNENSKQVFAENNTHELLSCHQAVLRELTEKLKCDDENISFLNAIFTTRKRFNLRIGVLSNDFWINVEKVANLGFNGIISYFRENYPNCSENDLRFIALSCLKLSNEVMRLCLDLTNIKTVSSYKTYVLKNITGKNQNIDEFINNFIQIGWKIHNL